ncbi:helix-turn-helix domain-containing protein [Paracholeplasma manati]|uniref:helix-turn-helix domain-containing protein n=1 Tax=Paracholeplasma manati TaxID=591373 RepID=UPI002408479D|nr:helix-turn-helix transcriptional regulator [Paracholeplasma manati]MDG0888319.1 helix-turn-helix transcriptional regulator [Paracholeplasma manati]
MITINLTEQLEKQKMTSKELCQIIGITEANLSILRSGKAKAIRFTTLDAICNALNCTPGDILKFEEGVQSDDDF